MVVKKIGVLTYFWANNFGMYAQAISTLAALQNVFPDGQIELVNVSHWPRKPLRPAGLRSLLHMDVVSFGKMFRQDWRQRRAIRRLPKSTPALVTYDRQEAIDYVRRQNYDLVVCGADVILKYANSPDALKDDLPPVYWLPKDLGVPHAMLASSAGPVQIHMFKPWQREMLAESADGFAMLAVRDSLTCKLLSDLGFANDPRLRTVPDPTFTWQIDPRPAEILWRRIGIKTNKKIIGIRTHDTPLIREVIRKLRATGRYCVVAIVPEVHGVDYEMTQLGMFEWMGILRHFDAHITMSFHDTIFCVKNGIPDVLVDESDRIDRETGNSKNQVLHKQLGMPERYFSPFVNKVDPDEVVALVDRLIQLPAPVCVQQERMVQQAALYVQAAEKLKECV